MKKILFVLLAVILMIPSYAADNNKNGNIIILMYHDFREGYITDKDDQAYVTTDKKFREDIGKLHSLGYESMNLEMLHAGNYDPKKDYYIITVDDGYISNYEILFPILVELEIYADIFMCTEDTVRKNHFQFNDAKKMENSGFVKIYSHYTSHVDITKMNIEEFTRIAEKAYRNIEKKVSEDRLRIFAYPHGAYSQETAESLYNMDTVFQMVQEAVEMSDPNWNPEKYGILYRVNVEYDVDMIDLVEYYITQFCSR